MGADKGYVQWVADIKRRFRLVNPYPLNVYALRPICQRTSKSAHVQISILGMRHTGRNSSGKHDEYTKNFANIQKNGGFVKG